MFQYIKTHKLLISSNLFLISVIIIINIGNFGTGIGKLFNKTKETKNCFQADNIYKYRNFGYQWKKITCCAEFQPRDGAGAVVFLDSLRLIGGWNPSDKNNFPLFCNNEIWSSNDGDSWKRTKKNTFVSLNKINNSDWEGRHSAGYVVFKNKMWIVGGDANQGHYQSDIWSSLNGVEWVLVAKNPPWSPRVLHSTVVFKEKIFVIGGQTLPQFAQSVDYFYNDVWSSSDGINWDLLIKHAPFKPRGMISNPIVFKDKIWIIGGGTFETPNNPLRKFYNDIWNSEDGIKWNLISNQAPWSPRQYHSVVVFDNKIWVIAGFDSEKRNNNDVWFSEDGFNWTNLPNTPWKARHATSVFVFKNSLFIASGNNMENDVWKLELLHEKK